MTQTTAASAPGSGALTAHLQAIEELATSLQDDPEALLSLLRHLEQVHRSIQDGPFRSSLPTDRNALYRLLGEMERSGGWPYIPRLQLRTFLDLLQRDSDGAEDAPATEDASESPPPLAA